MAQIQLQMLFSATEEKQQKARILKATVKDAIESSQAYRDAKEVYDKAKETLKQAEIAIKSGFMSDLDEIDKIKADLDLDKDNMTVLALEKFKQGETLVVKGKNGFEYEAEFTVKFKKSDKQSTPAISFGMGFDD